MQARRFYSCGRREQGERLGGQRYSGAVLFSAQLSEERLQRSVIEIPLWRFLHLRLRTALFSRAF